jgi:hypothetical protein
VECHVGLLSKECWSSPEQHQLRDEGVRLSEPRRGD